MKLDKPLVGLVEELQLHVLIVVDQAEEIFVRADESGRRAFGAFLQVVQRQLPQIGKLSVLIAIREDFLGRFWEWTQELWLSDLWHNTLRISRLSTDQAGPAISRPLEKQGVQHDQEFVDRIVQDLQELGDGAVFPPYLQIVGWALFDEVDRREEHDEPRVDIDLYEDLGSCADLIAAYIDEKLFEGLTEPYRLIAEEVLNALTGSGGLRTLLTLEDLSRQIDQEKKRIAEVVEILVQRRVVRPVTSNGETKGYELVHDFLSRTFFERLSPTEQKRKRVVELFRRSLAEWRAERALIAPDRLEMFRQNASSIIWDREAITLVVESSLVTNRYQYWLKAFRKEIRAAILGDIILQSPHVGARANAVKSLGTKQYWGDKYWYHTYTHLAQALGDDDAKVRRLTVKRLGVLEARLAVGALLNRLAEEKNQAVLAETVNTLGVLRDRRAVAPLSKMLEPSSTDLRRHEARSKIACAAATALGIIGGDEAAQVLLAHLQQITDGRKQYYHDYALSLVEGLRRTAYRPAADSLIQLARQRRGPLRAEAIRALGSTKEPSAVGAIIDILKSDHSQAVQDAALEALGEIGDPGAIEFLLDTLQSADRDLLLKTLAALSGPVERASSEHQNRVLEAMELFVSIPYDSALHRAIIRVLVASTAHATLGVAEKAETLLKSIKGFVDDSETLRLIHVALARTWIARSRSLPLKFRVGDRVLDPDGRQSTVVESRSIGKRERITVVSQQGIQRIWVDKCKLREVQQRV